MKTHRRTLILATLLGFVAPPVAAAEKPAIPPDKAPVAGKLSSANEFAARVQQVQDEIAALSKYRKENPPPPDPAHNPLRIPGSAPVVVAPAPAEGDPVGGGAVPVTAEPGPGASLALLQQGVAALKVGGTIELGGRTHRILNDRPYKEGDVVQTQVQGKTVYLRVKEIAKRSVTLSLNDAEMTLK